jgi:hypothetical protein
MLNYEYLVALNQQRFRLGISLLADEALTQAAQGRGNVTAPGIFAADRQTFPQ